MIIIALEKEVCYLAKRLFKSTEVLYLRNNDLLNFKNIDKQKQTIKTDMTPMYKM